MIVNGRRPGRACKLLENLRRKETDFYLKVNYSVSFWELLDVDRDEQDLSDGFTYSYGGSPGIALSTLTPVSSQHTFTFEELSFATNGFSNDFIIGQGGFGYVYKGLLVDGKEVAIKQLKSDSRQGDREFLAEVETIGRVHHRNLVSLVGYYSDKANRLLVYEFVPNKALEFHLHGKSRQTMDWTQRMQIAIGSAKGLAYLHEECCPKIIHRDIKAANILLDFDFNPKVADFGLAKFSSDHDTHVSTRIMGTFGYLAPEYAATGKLTEKSDIYSFGVVLLELITGRLAASSTDEGLVELVKPFLPKAVESGNYDVLMDPSLSNNYNVDQMACMVACAAACVRHSAKLRPKMSQVVRVLEGHESLEHLTHGVTQGHSSLYGLSEEGSAHGSWQHGKVMKFSSSDYSSHTGKSSQMPISSSNELDIPEVHLGR